MWMPQAHRASLSGLVILSLLAQAAIPLQAHTTLASVSTGQVIVVCTWAGPREQPWPHGGDDGDRIAYELSPAFLFSQLLSSADLFSHAAAVDEVRVPVITLTESPSIAAFPHVASIYAIRAPPLTTTIDA